MRSILIAAVLTLAATSSEAQSARPVSFQASLLGAKLGGSDFTGVDAGFGLEAQIRYTKRRLSIGGGFETTRHSASGGDLSRTGVFVEPRLVIPTQSDKIGPYVSGRLSLLRIAFDDQGTTFSSSGGGLTVNGGGGILFALSPRLALDLGVTIGFASLGRIRYSSGGTSSSGLTGSNVLFRTGISIGL